MAVPLLLSVATSALVGRLGSPVMCALSSKDALLSQTLDGLALDESLRPQIGELLLSLERENPTASPARSPLLNGVWELQFAGAPAPGLVDSPTRELALALYSAGYSPGALVQFLKKLPPPLSTALSLARADVTITSDESPQPRGTTEVTLLIQGNEQIVQFRSNLKPVSGVRLKEEVIEVELLGQRLLLPGPLSRTRQLYVTYLDDELLVVRDESGIPDVLVRKDKFGGPFAAEPSFSDDDSRPGV
eukprot:scaffold189124_cov27-Tisochrysis_lutea.AAC.2